MNLEQLLQCLGTDSSTGSLILNCYRRVLECIRSLWCLCIVSPLLFITYHDNHMINTS